jgi:hypothetical protein
VVTDRAGSPSVDGADTTDSSHRTQLDGRPASGRSDSRALSSTPPEPLPATLSSSQTKLVYLYLRFVDGGTVTDIRDNLGIKTINLYPVLQRLVEHGLVTRQGERYECCQNT